MDQKKYNLIGLLTLSIFIVLAHFTNAQDQQVNGKLSVTPFGWGTSLIPDSNGNMVFTGYSGNQKGEFIYRVYDGISYTNLFHIKPSGRIGLRIPEPVGELDVKGLTYLRAAPVHDIEVEQIRVGRSDSDIRYHSIYSSHSGMESRNYLQFRLHDPSVGIPHQAQLSVMTLYGSGNVGIGSSSPPTHRLEVDGKIKTKEVIVTVAGWADHVFKPYYELMPLPLLDAFIKAHGHLPSIPTEAEVMENGVSLGEMNVKLLEKIEELTLHTISQESSIKEQRELINELIKRIDKLENKN